MPQRRAPARRDPHAAGEFAGGRERLASACSSKPRHCSAPVRSSSAAPTTRFRRSDSEESGRRVAYRPAIARAISAVRGATPVPRFVDPMSSRYRSHARHPLSLGDGGCGNRGRPIRREQGDGLGPRAALQFTKLGSTPHSQFLPPVLQCAGAFRFKSQSRIRSRTIDNDIRLSGVGSPVRSRSPSNAQPCASRPRDGNVRKIP